MFYICRLLIVQHCHVLLWHVHDSSNDFFDLYFFKVERLYGVFKTVGCTSLDLFLIFSNSERLKCTHTDLNLI